MLNRDLLMLASVVVMFKTPSQTISESIKFYDVESYEFQKSFFHSFFTNSKEVAESHVPSHV